MHVNGLKNKHPRPASVAALSNTFNLFFLPCGSVGGATVIKIRSVGSNPTLVIYFLCPRVGPFPRATAQMGSIGKLLSSAVILLYNRLSAHQCCTANVFYVSLNEQRDVVECFS